MHPHRWHHHSNPKKRSLEALSIAFLLGGISHCDEVTNFLEELEPGRTTRGLRQQTCTGLLKVAVDDLAEGSTGLRIRIPGPGNAFCKAFTNMYMYVHVCTLTLQNDVAWRNHNKLKGIVLEWHVMTHGNVTPTSAFDTRDLMQHITKCYYIAML